MAVVVQRLWLNFKRNLDHITSAGGTSDGTSAKLHQLFVTANPILRNSVAKSFCALKSGYVPAEYGEEAELMPDEQDLSSLCGVPDECWPLFLRAHNWLRLIDATLEQPFFSAAERSTTAANSSGWHSEAGGKEYLLFPNIFTRRLLDVPDPDSPCCRWDGVPPR